MSARRWMTRFAVAALVGVSALVSTAASSPGSPADAQTAALGAGGEYHPLPPARIFDSRTGLNDVAPL